MHNSVYAHGRASLVIVLTCRAHAGVLADSLVARKVNVTTVRKAVQAVAFLVPATALVALSQPNLPPQVGGPPTLESYA